MQCLSFTVIATALVVPASVMAQPVEPPVASPAPPAAAPAAAAPTVTIGGYLEEYDQLQLQDASNRITNLRGFDNRSRTLTLSNVALDVKAEQGPLTVRLVVQAGHTPASYYLAEPTSPGTSSVDTSTGELWKYVQAATISARAPGAVVIEAGLFPSPIGPEVIPVKDNWNWSRSNLFFALPFYHTGVTVSRPFAESWTAKLHVYNGWNSVVDNNGYPSVALSASYASGTTTAQLLYFGGVERADGAREGAAWRNLFDAFVQTAATDVLSLAAHADAGVEPNDIGTSAWAGGAAYAKLQITPALYAAARADYFYEWVPARNGLAAAAIFFPVTWVAEGTATLAYQPIDHASVRLEVRHDHAASDAYFGGEVARDPTTMAFVPNRRAQDTLTLGVTAWF